MATVARRPRRWWRWPLYLGLSLLVLLALLFVALRTSFAREQVRTRVNGALAGLFRGQIQLDRIGQITLWGVRDVDARIFDPERHQVIRVQGLSVRASLPSLGWQFIAHSDRPAIELAAVHVDFADVTLREDEELGVTLASTFLPREAPEASAATPPSEAATGPRLYIARVELERIWAHGRVTGSPALDADLMKLAASLRQSPTEGFALNLDGVELTTRALPLAADPRGDVSGVIEAPPADTAPLRLQAALDGYAAGSPLALEVSWVGDYVHAAASLSRVPAGFVKQAAGLELADDVAVAAEIDGPLPQLDFRAEMVADGARVTAAGYAVVTQGRELAASVTASGVDLARISAGAPQSELRIHAGALLFEADEGLFLGSHRVDVEQGRVAGQATPALWVIGKDRLDTQAGVSSAGKLGMTDPGASLRGAYALSLPTHGRDSVTLSLDAKLEDPPRLVAFGVCAADTASLSAQLRPSEHTLTGKAALSLRHVDLAIVHARNVEMQARASGSLSDPHLVAGLSADLLAGHAHADLDYAPGNQQLDVLASDLDLVRLSHSAGLNTPIKQGKLSVDAHLKRHARAGNYQLDGAANADLGQLGSLRVVAREFELPSSSPSLTRIGALRGELKASGKLELETLSGLLTAAGTPIERTTGHVRFELSAKHERDDPRGLLLEAQLDTNGLRIVEQRTLPTTYATTSDAVEAEPLALEGIDLHLALHTWPSDGEAVGTLILRDAGGTLAEIQAELGLARIWPSGLGNVAELSAAPLKLSLQVPLRKLQGLPALIRPAALRGRLSVDAELEGSVAEPRVKAEIIAESL